MLPSERRRRIVEALSEQPSVGTEDLARTFAVSSETVRRDLLRLQGDGLLERVHGGALAPARPHAHEDSHELREATNAAGKARMAEVAVALLPAGATVVLDVGTSALAVARRVPQAWRGRVLTSSLPVAAELARRAGVEVLVAGGRLRPGDDALSGPHTAAFFAEYYADLALLGSGGLHPEAGLTDYHPDEVEVRRTVIARADRAVALVDATKHGTVAARRVCGLEALDAVISDATPDAALVAALAHAGTRLLLPAAAAAEGARPAG